MSDDYRNLTDRLGVYGILTYERMSEQAEHITTIQTKYILDVMEILETLNWNYVDVYAVEKPGDGDATPMLAFQPPHPSFLGGDQAALTVSPITEEGRRKEFDSDVDGWEADEIDWEVPEDDEN